MKAFSLGDFFITVEVARDVKYSYLKSTTDYKNTLQGALPPDQGFCPWTPLRARSALRLPYRFALRAHHVARQLKCSWIRQCIKQRGWKPETFAHTKMVQFFSIQSHEYSIVSAMKLLMRNQFSYSKNALKLTAKYN